MKEDREPSLHKLAHTQHRTNHPRKKNGDTIASKRGLV